MDMDQERIRNFCIIAHIDHGKSTLSDRFLELTGTIERREMMDQVLDSMDLERERGITIKAKAVRMSYRAEDGTDYWLNLIDTPGHVDFAYEVSRALAACEGAILVVDAVKGIQAQTLANLYVALEHDLAIVPVVNKIDLPSADPDAVAEEMAELLGVPVEKVFKTSAKEGTGIEAVLEAVIEEIPPPGGDPTAPLRALVFDSHYDSYKGVVAYVRVVDGALSGDAELYLMARQEEVDVVEVGIFRPEMTPVDRRLAAGEVGYVATGLKDVKEWPVGDTLTELNRPVSQALPGYQPVQPMVFAGLYPMDTDDYEALRDALDKLRLNDASLTYTPETSQALNFGFRCGFLGLLHMDIVRERLEREYDFDLVLTPPNVEYHVLRRDGEVVKVNNPADLPPEGEVEEIHEPWVSLNIFIPSEYVGPVMELAMARRGEMTSMEYLDAQRVLLKYELPLSEMIVDFYDHLKSRTRGYASMDYQFSGYRPGDLVRLDVLVNERPVDAFSLIVHRDKAYHRGDVLVRRLKENIPRQLFRIPIQAAIGNRVIARQTVKALRKNVLAKCYGGDITRKRKLLEKQREGKKRMKQIGEVSIPLEAFLAVLRLES